MNVVVNGDRQEIAGEAKVVDVLERVGRGPDARGVAVAVNGEVIPRSRWRSERLREDDRVEVLNAVGGG